MRSDIAQPTFAHIPPITRGYFNSALCTCVPVCSRAASSCSVGRRNVMYHRRILPRKHEGASEKLDHAKKKDRILDDPRGVQFV